MQTKANILESGANGQGAGSGALSAVSREFDNFLTDVEDLIKAMTVLTGEDLARARVELSARVARAKASVGEIGDALTDRARRTAKVTNGFVHERPWQAIGIGAGVGLLAGLLLARRG